MYFGPSKPADAKDGNWIQTMPEKAPRDSATPIVR
ncbi:hypothetical protein [Edaphobacter aggregans]